MEKYMAAVCQMDSQDDKEQNLKTAARLIDEASSRGAQLIVLPETMNYMGQHQKEHAEYIPPCGRQAVPASGTEASEAPTAAFLSAKAKEHGIWLAGGSIPEISENGRPKNTMLFFGPDGVLRARYTKLHMFDAEIEGVTSSCESAVNTPGSEIVLTDTPLGRIGMAICYDIRFPELFRIMAANGAEIICVSSCFTKKTVADHWEILLRARAIENGVYILASNQYGEKTTMTAGGCSMIIDPWGNVTAKAGEETGCICGEIDSAFLSSVRRQIPSLFNRREDIYTLRGQVHLYP